MYIYIFFFIGCCQKLLFTVNTRSIHFHEGSPLFFFTTSTPLKFNSWLLRNVFFAGGWLVNLPPPLTYLPRNTRLISRPYLKGKNQCLISPDQKALFLGRVCWGGLVAPQFGIRLPPKNTPFHVRGMSGIQTTNPPFGGHLTISWLKSCTSHWKSVMFWEISAILMVIVKLWGLYHISPTCGRRHLPPKQKAHLFLEAILVLSAVFFFLGLPGLVLEGTWWRNLPNTNQKKEENFRIYTPPIMQGLTHQGVFCRKGLNSWWPPIQAPTCSIVRIACYKKVMNLPGVRWSLWIDDHKWPRYTQIRFYVGQK